MRQTITISLPEEVYDGLRNRRTGINISAVCQKALMLHLGVKESKAHRDRKIRQARQILKRALSNIRSMGVQVGHNGYHKDSPVITINSVSFQ